MSCSGPVDDGGWPLESGRPGPFSGHAQPLRPFPASILPYVSPLIILGEILLGLALLSGRQVRHCLAVCEVLFYTFALAVASVLHRGLQIRCACFGVSASKFRSGIA